MVFNEVYDLIYDSCFLAIGFISESTKLEIRSVGPPLPETRGLPTGLNLCILVSVQNSGILGGFWPELSHLWVISSICPLVNNVLTIVFALEAVCDTMGFSRGLYNLPLETCSKTSGCASFQARALLSHFRQTSDRNHSATSKSN